MNQALKTVIPVKQKTTEKEKRMIWLKPDAATAKAQLGGIAAQAPDRARAADGSAAGTISAPL
ncbi:MAG: hypothetical protein ACLUD0_09705 [Eubacterium ramulus]